MTDEQCKHEWRQRFVTVRDAAIAKDADWQIATEFTASPDGYYCIFCLEVRS